MSFNSPTTNNHDPPTRHEHHFTPAAPDPALFILTEQSFGQTSTNTNGHFQYGLGVFGISQPPSWGSPFGISRLMTDSSWSPASFEMPAGQQYQQGTTAHLHMGHHPPEIEFEASNGNMAIHDSTTTVPTAGPPTAPIQTYVCQPCNRHFSAKKDLKRHTRTLHDQHNTVTKLVCHVQSWKRKKRPFSRKDNYAKHLRKVHSITETNPPTALASTQPSSPGSDSDSDDEDSFEYTPITYSTKTEASIVATGRKRKAEEDAEAEEDLDKLTREALIQKIGELKRRCQNLEEEKKAERRGYKRKERAWRMLLRGDDEEEE
jgi:hypothetical protein